jgi:uncharacterized protein YndB with AHSA1/START domain
MTVSIDKTVDASQQTVVLERTFTAPRDLVFSLFTDPAHLVRWWCPYPLTFAECEFDARPGGSLRYVMQASDGTRFPKIGTMLEVEPPARLVFSAQEDMDESGVPGTEVLQTITFTEHENQTVVRVQIDVVRACASTPQSLRGMAVGWMQDFGRLEFYLLPLMAANGSKRGKSTPVITTPSDREIMVTRSFDAPPEQIFKALTDATVIPSWWGPRDVTTTVEQMDVRPSGRWRFLQHRPDGDEFSGEYFLIDPSELIVTSFEIGPIDGKTPFDQLQIDAVHLFERDGSTRMTSISLFPSKAERDNALDSDIVSRALESYERLAHVLSATV